MWTSHSSGAIKSIEPQGRFAGYASVFGIVDHQRDMVMAGAFRTALTEPLQNIKLLWQHQWAEPIGKIDVLFEDAHGLYMEGQLLLEVARAKEAYALLKEGVLNGLSIGYRPEKFRTDPDTGVRRLEAVSLFEISLVTMPANAHARVSVVKQAVEDDYIQLLHALIGAERALITLR
jgi:uncharacterized protein